MTKLERPAIQNKCNLFLHQLRFVKPEITAANLIALGIPPGPKIGELMKRLLTARLDKKVRNREEELRLLKRWTNKGR
jgi:tRNA nucleotidyltransferase (CCA-adding enzyme)